ncbi:MAG: hypothetical protein Q8P59_05830, partial [Dehalococcoidia bacterium]|nr:hypothetical protein [Dehalococcoidia bacterium]
MGKKDKTTAPSGLPDETLRELVARALDLDPQSEGFRSFLDELLSLTWAALSRFTATLAQEGQDGAGPSLVALAGQPDLALAAVEALSSIKSQESSQR